MPHGSLAFLILLLVNAQHYSKYSSDCQWGLKRNPHQRHWATDSAAVVRVLLGEPSEQKVSVQERLAFDLLEFWVLVERSA